jgi:hydroxyethylthiazole kinase-like uncharacterized protein yjeF
MTESASLPVCRTTEIRALEAEAAAHEPEPPLMERAGLAAAELARSMLAGGQRVLVVAGPGNNGGDGFVVARHLKSWWFDVTVLFTGSEQKLAADAAAALDAWRSAGGTTTDRWPKGAQPDLIVDALFGIGLERPLEGPMAELVMRMNGSTVPVLALDVPSGLDADTGRVLGIAVEAAHTATFIALKPGLLTLEGPDHAGELHVFDLGVEMPGTLPGHLLDPSVLQAALPPRRSNTHKGTFGNAGIVGGADGMTGAALLAGRAALKLGAGRTFVGCLGGASVDAAQPELMLRPAADVVSLDGLSVLAVGPGLGASDAARALVTSAIDRDVPLLLDADALNLVAADSRLARQVAQRPTDTLLTPHPAEAARLLGCTTAEVQSDRVANALLLAERYRAAVVLKGAGSVCALPNGQWFINPSGNPGLASAGMGDVLAGIIAALVAQGCPPVTALLAGVHLHGLAGDRLREAIGGPVGITASEVTDAARAILNEAIYPAP